MLTLISAYLGPWLAVIKKLPWRLIGNLLLAAALALVIWRIYVWRVGYLQLETVQAALMAEQGCKPDTRCAERLRGLRAAGTDAVEKALQTAQGAASKEQAKRDADARAEAARLMAAAGEATATAKRWEVRYRESLKLPACAAWAAQEVPCAISD